MVKRRRVRAFLRRTSLFACQRVSSPHRPIPASNVMDAPRVQVSIDTREQSESASASLLGLEHGRQTHPTPVKSCVERQLVRHTPGVADPIADLPGIMNHTNAVQVRTQELRRR